MPIEAIYKRQFLQDLEKDEGYLKAYTRGIIGSPHPPYLNEIVLQLTAAKFGWKYLTRLL